MTYEQLKEHYQTQLENEISHRRDGMDFIKSHSSELVKSAVGDDTQRHLRGMASGIEYIMKSDIRAQWYRTILSLLNHGPEAVSAVDSMFEVQTPNRGTYDSRTTQGLSDTAVEVHEQILTNWWKNRVC